ncbi:ATP-dependent DNA helicase [Trichonephila clavipes]|nr:ATP-dependent DNA helicase [Trichonephila clavipes]
MAEVLRKCKIIIWDECTMAHKHSLEALDRTLKDIKNNTKLFGGALLLWSGDFRQTLSAIPLATYADEINACLKESYLWRSISKLCLTIDMRVQLQNYPLTSRFSEQLLDIGNGRIQLYVKIHNIFNSQKIFATLWLPKMN